LELEIKEIVLWEPLGLWSCGSMTEISLFSFVVWGNELYYLDLDCDIHICNQYNSVSSEVAFTNTVVSRQSAVPVSICKLSGTSPEVTKEDFYEDEYSDSDLSADDKASSDWLSDA